MEEEIKYSSGVFVLTPSESKRLIAKAVVQMPEVQQALAGGRVIIATGTTNAYVAEEILGETFPKEEYISGHIIDGGFGKSGSQKRLQPFVLENGKKVDVPWTEAIKQFEASDVFIKGANAIDAEGNAGILIGHPSAGTIGAAIGVVCARGAHLIMPVGLEKMVPSVLDASDSFHGVKRIEHTLDCYPVGYFPVVNGTIITEIQALEALFDITATHMASGGIVGSEGSVTILVEGLDEEVVKCMALIKSIKGEPSMRHPS